MHSWFRPSYSKANIVLSCGYRRALLCPSWHSESPRKDYLTWCARWHKQTNNIPLCNALLSLPPHCIPSDGHVCNTKEQDRDKRNLLPIEGESPDYFWYILKYCFTFEKSKFPVTYSRVLSVLSRGHRFYFSFCVYTDQNRLWTLRVRVDLRGCSCLQCSETHSINIIIVVDFSCAVAG